MTEQPRALDAYFAALARLKAGAPQIVPKGCRITNDAVSLEAGRGKGSIKKSRSVFADLVRAIDEAAAEQANPRKQERDKLLRTRNESGMLRVRLEEALARELSLLKELFDVKKRLAQLTGEKILPLRGRHAAAKRTHLE
jgi:hypothetical protein